MLRTWYVLTMCAAVFFCASSGVAQADETFPDLASARTFAAGTVNGQGLFFNDADFTAAGLTVDSVIVETSGSVLSSTVFYAAIDGGDVNGQVWISRGPAGNPADFGTASCGNREIRGPLTLGPFTAFEADCDISMVYQFVWGGSEYAVGTKYYGGLTREGLGTIVSRLTQIGTGPVLPSILPYQSGLEFQVRPTMIIPTGDGSGILAGRPKHYRSRRGKLPSLRWSSWTTGRARASAAMWLNDCRPYCAAGRFHPYPVKIRASRVRDGHFTRIKVTRAGRPRAPRTGLIGTYRLIERDTDYFWKW